MSTLLITRWRNLHSVEGWREEHTFAAWGATLIRAAAERYRGDANHGGWSPARFFGDVRRSERAEAVTALALDVDKLSSIEAMVNALRGRRGMWCSTKRHRPEAARVRVLLEVSRPMRPAEHLAVWRAAAAKLGAVGVVVDAATKDSSRFWFMPGRIDLTVPIAAGWLDGEAVDVDKIVAWDETRRVAPEPRAAVHPTGGGYAAGALRSAAHDVANAPKGARNPTLIRQSYALGGLVGAGALCERDAVEHLLAGALANGWREPEARDVIGRGLAAGMAKPRPRCA
jgi:hypothetical protein